MAGSVFPLSLITQVTLVPPALVPGVPNQSTVCIVTQDATPAGWAAGQEYATYNSSGLAQIAADFGIDSNTYAIASQLYAQSPNIFAVPGAYLVVLPRLTSPSLETIPAAVARGLALVYFYGVLIDEELATSDPTAFATLATYIETSGCLFFYASSDANDLNPGSPLDLVRQAGEVHTRCTYYGESDVLVNGAAAQQTQMFAAAYAGRMLSVNFLASNSTLTMAYKNLKGIPADGSLTNSQLTAAQAAGVDIYPNISSVIGLYISGANQFSDMVYNDDWLALAVQIAGVDEIVGQANKLPLTEAGIGQLKDAMKVPLNQAVSNGFIAPGAWPEGAATFGDQASFLRNIAQTGFYVYSTPVAQLTQAQLATRQAPPIQIAVLAAGAVQSAAVIINVALG
ncbi:MAG: DUF3383 family protein [Elusimicrobia bacterium]|nr:DUF3383 family protein [Elusimicrobiota bacterium]